MLKETTCWFEFIRVFKLNALRTFSSNSTASQKQTAVVTGIRCWSWWSSCPSVGTAVVVMLALVAISASLTVSCCRSHRNINLIAICLVKHVTHSEIEIKSPSCTSSPLFPSPVLRDSVADKTCFFQSSIQSTTQYCCFAYLRKNSTMSS